MISVLPYLSTSMTTPNNTLKIILLHFTVAQYNDRGLLLPLYLL